MGCLTLVPRICSMNRVPHIGSHLWAPGIMSQVKVHGPEPTYISQIPGEGSHFSGMSFENLKYKFILLPFRHIIQTARKKQNKN